MSSIRLSTYADLARANACVYLGGEARGRDGEAEGDAEGGEGKEAGLSIMGDHILATELPLL